MKHLTIAFAFAIVLALVGTIALAHEGHKKEHEHAYPKQAFTLARGEAIYKQYCAKCHGITGYNAGPFPDYMDPRPTNFLDREYMVMRSRVDLFETVREGRAGTRMKSWEGRLSEEEMWNVVAWIDHLFNHASYKVAHKH